MGFLAAAGFMLIPIVAVAIRPENINDKSKSTL